MTYALQGSDLAAAQEPPSAARRQTFGDVKTGEHVDIEAGNNTAKQRDGIIEIARRGLRSP